MIFLSFMPYEAISAPIYFVELTEKDQQSINKNNICYNDIYLNNQKIGLIGKNDIFLKINDGFEHSFIVDKNENKIYFSGSKDFMKSHFEGNIDKIKQNDCYDKECFIDAKMKVKKISHKNEQPFFNQEIHIIDRCMRTSKDKLFQNYSVWEKFKNWLN